MKTKNNLIYVYGVQVGGPPSEVCFNGISAILKKVQEEDFGAGHFRENLKRTEWVQEKVMDHQQVLQVAMQQSVVIPFKFGVVFESAHNILQMLQRDYQRFLNLYGKLNQKDEWGLKIKYQPEVLRQKIEQQEPEVLELTQAIADSGAGTAFLLKKKRSTLIEHYVSYELNKFRNMTFDAVIKVTNRLKQDSSNVHSFSGEVGILELAILADDQEHSLIARSLECIRQQGIQKGILVDFTGPWPPYNFVA